MRKLADFSFTNFIRTQGFDKSFLSSKTAKFTNELTESYHTAFNQFLCTLVALKMIVISIKAPTEYREVENSRKLRTIRSA